jgi:hypothetical protein
MAGFIIIWTPCCAIEATITRSIPTSGVVALYSFMLQATTGLAPVVP